MIERRVIYSAEQQDFINDVDENLFIEKMINGAAYCGVPVGEPELRSWEANSGKIGSLLRLSGVSGAYVTFECLVPYTRQRIDCMIYGMDSGRQEKVIHIELKQWGNKSVKPNEDAGNIDVSDEEDENTVIAYTGGRFQTKPHPSQQVKQYDNYLTGFIEVLSRHEVSISGVAYCYNYSRNETPNVLYYSQFDQLQERYKTYSREDVRQLAEVLKAALCGGNGLSVFNKVISSRILPSKKLLDSAAEMVDAGNADYFSLLEEQIVAKNTILSALKKINRKKSVVLVKGGPGTGKTVIALHVLAELAHSGNRLNIRYATKSKPLLEGVKHNLPRGSRARLLFSSLAQFIPANFQENELDMLIVDEAHRIGTTPNSQYTKAEKRTEISQIDSIVRCAKICVFFIDDKQAIRSQDVGSSDMIRESARKFGADVREVELWSQFRCNGSDNYMDWLEQILYNQNISAKFDPAEFDFRVFNSPQDLYDEIVRKNTGKETARLTAGFCWPWSGELDENGNLIKDVKIGSFAMPWETKGTISPTPKGYVKWYEWAYKPEGIKQVGCIYTAQGFEFDYVGVIIGPDLYYNEEKNRIETCKAATRDPMLRHGGASFDDYVRNIYRVLMSRGMKGCYVYCCDEPLREYLKAQLNKSNAPFATIVSSHNTRSLVE